MTPTEILTMIRAALGLQAAELRREAASRTWYGPQHAEYRAKLRAKAAQAEKIRNALTVTDAADFALYPLPLIVRTNGRPADA